MHFYFPIKKICHDKKGKLKSFESFENERNAPMAGAGLQILLRHFIQIIISIDQLLIQINSTQLSEEW